MALPIGQGGIDYPDFGMSTPGTSVSVLLDMGELAARLGSPSLYDRHGNIVFWDNFEFGLGNWQMFKDASQINPFLSTFNTLHSPYVCAILHDGATATYTQISMGLPYPVLGVFGFELRTLYRTSFDWYTISLNLYTGTGQKTASIKFDDTNQEILIRNGSASYTKITDLPGFNTSYPQWNIIKLVADYENNGYLRLIYNNTSIDLTSYVLWTQASAAEPRLGIGLNYVGNSGGDRIILLDNFIVTTNEPL